MMATGDDKPTARQRRAQNAMQAIATSDETRDTRLAELARLRAYLDRLWLDVESEP